MAGETVAFTIRISLALYGRIKAEAAARRVSVQSIFQQAVENHIAAAAPAPSLEPLERSLHKLLTGPRRSADYLRFLADVVKEAGARPPG